MKEKSIGERRVMLNAILADYIRTFEQKHECTFEFAVGDDLMSSISFGDVMILHISDIVHDIDSDLPKGLIFEWNDYNIDNHPKYINLHSYAKGARHEAKND